MAHGDDRPARPGDGCLQTLRGRARAETVVDPELGRRRFRDHLGGLLRSQERAREDEARRIGVHGEATRERLGLVAPPYGELPQLVRLARVGVRVSGEKDQHVPSIAPGRGAFRG